MGEILEIAIYVSLAIHVILLFISVWRVWRGENAIDRLIAADLVGTLTLAILVLVALLSRQAIYIDAALGLAALGFVAMVALAKYMADERIF